MNNLYSPIVLTLIFVTNAAWADASVTDKLVVTPPIIMPQELVLVTEQVLPPPTPVVFK
jgi:hypothetical protein